MKFSTQRIIIASFFVAFAMVAFFTGITYRNMQKTNEAIKHVNAAHQSLQILESVLDDMQDLEAGQQGYIITGSENFLTPYNEALNLMHTDSVSLRNIAKGDTLRKKDFEKLIALVHKKIEWEKLLVNSTRAGEHEAAVKQIRSEQGKLMMDSIRGLVYNVENRDRQVIQQANEERVIKAKATAKLFIFFSALFFIGLFISFFIIRRMYKIQHKSKDELSYFGTLVKNVHDAIFSTTADFTITNWNKGAEEIYGYTPKEAIGKKMDKLLMTDYGGVSVDKLVADFHRAGFFNSEVKQKKKSGEEVNILVSSSALYDHKGKISGTIAINKDVTNLRRVESQAAYLATLAEQTSDAIISLNNEGIIKSWNKGAEKMFGYTKEEIVGKFSPDFTHSGVTREMIQEWGKTLAEDNLNSIEVISYHKSGKAINCLSTNTTIKNENGVVTGFVTVLRDITEQKVAEKLLQNFNEELVLKVKEKTIDIKESEEKFRSLIEQSLTGIYIIQGDYFTYVNPQLAKIFGYSQEEMLANFKAIDVVYQPDRDMVRDTVEARLAGKEVRSNYNFRGIKKDGAVIYVEVFGTRTMQKGRPVTIGTLLDVTERRKAENALMESKEKIKKIISNVQVGLILQGPAAEILFTNEQACIMLGLTEDQLLGKTSFDPGWNVIHEDGTSFPGPEHPVPQAIANKKAVKNVVMGVYRPLTKDRIWLLVNAEPELDSEGNVIEVICSFSDITERKKAEEEIAVLQSKMDAAIRIGQIGYWSWDIAKDEVYWNDRMYEIYNVDRNTILKYDTVLSRVHPDDQKFHNDLIAERIKNKDSKPFEYRVQWPDGTLRYVLVQMEIISNEKDEAIRFQGTVIDITGRKKADLLLEGEKKVMEMIATGKSIKEILNTIALNYESNANNAICSVLLLNVEGTRLKHGAGPHLPDEYNNAIDGVEIGPQVGSCGTAAFTKETVIVADIANDPLWKNFRDLALRFGLKACWSTPILSNNKQVLGTFAIYYKDIHQPSKEDFILIERTANQVKIAVEQYTNEIRLKESEEKYRTLIEQATDGIIIGNPNGKFINANSAALKLFGYGPEEIKQQSIHSVLLLGENDSPLKFKELQEGKSILTTRTAKRKDGSTFFVEINSKMLPDGNFLGFARDITERKKAEDEIRKSDERFRLIATTTHDAIWERNYETNEIWGNEMHQQLYGLTIADTVPTQEMWSRKIHPDDRETIVTDFEKTLASEKNTWIAEYRFQTEDNGFRNIYGRTYIVRDKNGKPVRTMGSMADITERKKAEQELKTSEETKRLIMNSSLDAIVCIDTTGAITIWTPQAEKIFGWKEQEVLGKTLTEIIIPVQYRERHTKGLEKYLLTGKGSVINRLTELSAVNNKGEEFPVELTIVPFEQGGKTLFCGFIKDITERKKAQDLILKEKQLSNEIIDSIPGVFFLFDEKGKYIRWNKQLEIITGYSSDEIKELHPVNDFYDEQEERTKVIEAVKDVFAKGETTIEAAAVTKNGRKIPFYYSARPIVYEGKQCVIGTGIDISDRKKAEEKIKQTTEQLRQLSAHLQNVREEERIAIAREIHDELGQQLTVLKMDISWLNKKLGNKDEKLHKKIVDLSAMLDNTVKTVRRISSELRPSLLDDLGLIAAIEWHCREFEKRSGIKTKFITEVNELELPASLNTGLFRIFQESLTNVARHADANMVTGTLKKEVDKLCLTVTDNGKGFEPASIENKKTLGIIGMRERTQMMGGQYNIHSTVGKGTTVEVIIPVD